MTMRPANGTVPLKVRMAMLLAHDPDDTRGVEALADDGQAMLAALEGQQAEQAARWREVVALTSDMSPDMVTADQADPVYVVERVRLHVDGVAQRVTAAASEAREREREHLIDLAAYVLRPTDTPPVLTGSGGELAERVGEEVGRLRAALEDAQADVATVLARLAGEFLPSDQRPVGRVADAAVWDDRVTVTRRILDELRERA